jgi:hypothetical protein
MKFVDDLKQYKKSREDAITGKHAQAAQFKKDYQGKLLEVEEATEAYRVDFDEKVFEKLEKLKAQAEQLKIKTAKVNTQVELMEVGQLSGLSCEDVETQVAGYVASFNLDPLKEKIQKAKDEYLEALNNFSAATAKIEAARVEINELAPVIQEHNKTPIARAFRTYQDQYGLDEKYFISSMADFAPIQQSISRHLIIISDRFPGTINY